MSLPPPSRPAHSGRPRVLIVEDDDLLGQLLASHLSAQDYEVLLENNGSQAIARVRNEQPDAVVLDVNLPGGDGFSICRELRPAYLGVIIMLTRRATDMDRILGLEMGADDYLPKPVEPRLLEAHLKACLRRAASHRRLESPGDLWFGKLRISAAERSVQMAGESIALQGSEFDLLWLLASRAGSVLTRDEIMTALRGYGHDGFDRSIDMRISRLRKALGDAPDQPSRIKTVRSRGYLFSASG